MKYFLHVSHSSPSDHSRRAVVSYKRKYVHYVLTPGMQQSKTLLTIEEECDQKSLETVFLIAIWSTNGNRKLSFKRFFIQVRQYH